MDYNATAPIAPEARAAAVAALDEAGNPSSIHAEGRRARGLIDDARRAVAALAGGEPDEIVFTSGGTEADALGIAGLALLARRAGRGRLLTTAIEHPAVRRTADSLGVLGITVEEVAVDGDGRIDARDLAARLPGAGVLAIGAVNHELGTVQDPELAEAARAAGVLVHVDAVQAAGRRPLAPWTAVADTLALSGHKLGAPTGIGALWIRRGVDVAAPLGGGHQEHGRRGGTENLAGIAGLGAVAAAADPARWAAVAPLAARLEAGLVALGARIHGAGAPRAGHVVNAAFPGARGESIVIALDLAGVAVSTGAACTSGSVQPSAVLLGLGLPEAAAREAVRFSLGPGNTIEEVERVLALLPAIVTTARRRAS